MKPQCLLAHRRPRAALTLAVLVALLAAGLSLSPAPSLAQAGSGPFAYVGLFGDDAVVVVDLATRQVVSTIPVPPGPHGLAITPDGRKVYVSSDKATTVSAIDAATNRVVREIEVGREPHGVAMTPDGRTLLVGGWGADQVVFVDTASDTVTAQVPVAAAHNLAVTPDSRTAYVGSQAQGAPALVVLDLQRRAETARVPLERTPRGLSVSPDGRWLYFTVAGSDAVGVLDTSTNQIVAQIDIGPSPHFPLFTPSGARAVSDSQGLAVLAVIDPASRRVLGTVPTGQRPHWTAVDADSRLAYVTNEGSNDLTVIDLERMQPAGTIAVGGAPRKIVIAAGASGASSPPAQAGASRTPQPAADQPVAAVVRISGFDFGPPLTVRRGQPVAWTNADSVGHTVTSSARAFHSGLLDQGDRWERMFDAVGTYEYQCVPHSWMRGTVIVEE